ncbi:hypothetical protein PG990_004139 [Apiospora arundinis]
MLGMLEQAGWPFKEKGHLILHQVLENEKIVQWLLDRGVWLDFPQSELRDDLKKGEKDETIALLNQAAAQGNMAMFDHLVSLGADPSRSLALHYAAALYKPHHDNANATDAVIGHLIQKYHFAVDADDTCGGLVKLSDFTVIPSQEGPPLVRAVFHGNLPAIQSLLRRGALIDEKAIRTAIECDNLDVLQALLEAGGDATYGCCLAVARDKVEAAHVCLQHGADHKAAVGYNRELASKTSTHSPADK